MNYKILTLVFISICGITVAVMLYFTYPPTVMHLHNEYTTDQIVTIYIDAFTAFMASFILALLSFSTYVVSRSDRQ